MTTIFPKTLGFSDFSAWVIRPERSKGANDEIKRLKGPPARSRGPDLPPRLVVFEYCFKISMLHLQDIDVLNADEE